MNNSDMPANSTTLEVSNRYEEGYYDKVALGLTKREAFAMAAMQGLLANSHIADVLTSGLKIDVEAVLTSSSVRYADALLKELEK